MGFFHYCWKRFKPFILILWIVHETRRFISGSLIYQLLLRGFSQLKLPNRRSARPVPIFLVAIYRLSSCALISLRDSWSLESHHWSSRNIGLTVPFHLNLSMKGTANWCESGTKILFLIMMKSWNHLSFIWCVCDSSLKLSKVFQNCIDFGRQINLR